MSTPRPTGVNWEEAIAPVEARRRERAVRAFAEYLGRDVGGEPHGAFEAMASVVRRRPWAVSASVLRRAAHQAQTANGRGR